MSLSLAVIDELARALGADVPQVLRAALGRIEAAEQGVTASPVTVAVTAGVTDAVTGRAPSKAALRTRRWRARKAGLVAGAAGGSGASAHGAEASPGVTHTVTEASPTVTQSVTEASPVTVRDGVGDGGRQKENSPRPPIRKTSTPFPPKRRRRHRVTVDETAAAVPSRVFLDEHDARFREIGRMRGKSYPVHSGGWWFDPLLVAEAERRIRATVLPLRPSVVAMAAATGPPEFRVGIAGLGKGVG